MKRLVFMLAFSLLGNMVFSQTEEAAGYANEHFVDSMLTKISVTSSDTERVNLLSLLGEHYLFDRQDSAIFFLRKCIELAEKIKYRQGIHSGYIRMAFVMNAAGNYARALDLALNSLKIAEQLDTNKLEKMAESYSVMGLINRRYNNDSIAEDEFRQAIRLYSEAGIVKGMERLDWSSQVNLALIYLKRHERDSALYYAKEAYEISEAYTGRSRARISVTASTLARVYEEMDSISLARNYYLVGIEIDKKYIAPLLRVRLYDNFARFYLRIGKLDSCIYYAGLAFQMCRNHQFGELTTDAALLVASSYESLHMPDSALKYTKILIAAKDTIFNQSKLIQIQILNFDEGQRQKDIQREINESQERYANKVRYFALIATAAIFLLLSIILYRNNRNKQIANKTLESQKREIDQQRTKAENALQELKSTQTLLIQSEKMASLGELTAGVAHEIQNPLNFMNNFSEVNAELIDELQENVKAGNVTNALNISNDIKANEIKISHHGKRADAIVKGMLQHSRTSTGQKDPTDINVLADEYLRLAYHGLRAKDKDFNAKVKTDFDSKIGKTMIVSQDIGRVLLNLYNNAFYSISEKKKQQTEEFEPTVSVSTKKLDNNIQIRVGDNGNGIPQKIIDKIFQPFFTTKPAGQGTGLGLSLSYDIVKAHGGEIKVDTKEGEFTEFIITLPS